MPNAARLTAALLLTTFFGCSDDSGGAQSCEVNTDCPLPQSCIEGRCRLQCRRDADCPSGQRCNEEDAICEGGTGCDERTNPCPIGETCTQSGECVSLLGDARDPANPARDQGLPFIDAAPGTQPGNDDARVGPPTDDARVSPPDDDARVPPPRDAGPDPTDGPARPPGNLRYGDRCVCAADCASGFCVENKLRAARTCTERCDRNDDCPGIDTCLMAEVRPGDGVCPPPANGLEPGEVVGVCAPNETSLPCEAPEECTSGICLGLGSPVPWADPHDVCTVLCDNDSRCPAGYNCQSVQGANGNVNICAPALGPLATCMDYTMCGGVCPLDPGDDEGRIAACAQIDANQPGYCTCTCAHADDCPRGFSCSRAVESGDALRPGVCTPIAGYVCPVEALGVPPVPMECMSYQCLGGNEDQPFYSRCTSTCVEDRDCPENYTCNFIDDGMPGPDPRVCVPRN